MFLLALLTFGCVDDPEDCVEDPEGFHFHFDFNFWSPSIRITEDGNGAVVEACIHVTQYGCADFGKIVAEADGHLSTLVFTPDDASGHASSTMPVIGTYHGRLATAAAGTKV